MRLSLPGHDVVTAVYMGWAGVKNGDLLRLIEDSGFQIFITADKNLVHQQNLRTLPFAVLCLTAVDWEIIHPHLAAIRAAVDAAQHGSFQLVECGEFRR